MFKYIVSFLEYDVNERDNNARIVEITDEDDVSNSNIHEMNEIIVENFVHPIQWNRCIFICLCILYE